MNAREFSGDVADLYAQFRRGFPDHVVDKLAADLQLTEDHRVLDLGCGTGQLAAPLAHRVRAVIGLDPEPDMLAHAIATAREQKLDNITWMLGTDADLPALETVLGPESLAAITTATAVHLMDETQLFRRAARLLKPSGAIAVIANGTPLWLHDTDWSRAVKETLEEWLGTPGNNHCSTDAETRSALAERMREAQLDVSETVVEYTVPLSLEFLIGNIFSALGERLPSTADRLVLAEKIRRRMGTVLDVEEHVRVAALIGRKP